MPLLPGADSNRLGWGIYEIGSLSDLEEIVSIVTDKEMLCDPSHALALDNN